MTSSKTGDAIRQAVQSEVCHILKELPCKLSGLNRLGEGVIGKMDSERENK